MSRALDHAMEILCQDNISQHQPRFIKSFLDNYTISAQLLNYYNITVINSYNK